MKMSILSGAPKGFHSATEVLCELPQDVVAEVCHEVMQFLQYKAATVNISALQDRCQSCGQAYEQAQLQSAVNALTYLFRAACQADLSGEDLAAQLQSGVSWTDETVATVKRIWNEQGKLVKAVLEAHQLLSVGQLVDLEWKLGVAMTSEHCKNLNSPFITMLIKIAEPSGRVVNRSFEMSVPQFQNFSKQMKEMATILETV